MNPVFIEAVSVFGPGFPDWSATRAILTGQQDYEYAATPVINCGYLTPNIKRRTTLHMQMAFQATEQALQQTDVNPEQIELVFSSTDCDLGIADKIIMALTQPDKMVSPQNFQNVILNAAIGHLGIMLGNQASATSVSGGEYSFAVGLLQAAISVAVENHPVLYVTYDVLGPRHIDSRKPGLEPFSVGLLLTPQQTSRSLASFVASLATSAEESCMASAALEKVRNTVSAAKSLPLLSAIACQQDQVLMVPHCEQTKLLVELKSCHH